MKSMEKVTLTVNGVRREIATDPTRRLLDVIRDDLGLTGTKESCGAGECGACTVLLDGLPVNSCLIMVGSVDGASLVTVEGLGSRTEDMNPVQRAFVDKGAVQCGFCTPGMVVTATALLDKIADPDPAMIKTKMAGNLCRCTGYAKIVEAVQWAAHLTSDSGQDSMPRGKTEGGQATQGGTHER